MKFCLTTLFLSLFIVSQSLAQELTMFQGLFGLEYYQDANKLSAKEMKTVMAASPMAQEQWKKGNTHRAISFVLIGAGTGLYLWGLESSLNRDSFNRGAFIAATGAALASIGFTYSSLSLKKKAILSFNQSLEKQTYLNLELKPTNDGFGLVLNF